MENRDGPSGWLPEQQPDLYVDDESLHGPKTDGRFIVQGRILEKMGEMNAAQMRHDERRMRRAAYLVIAVVALVAYYVVRWSGLTQHILPPG